jgi:hypothetical protein
LVDTKQAEGLVLAVQNGTISLSIRSFSDKYDGFETVGTKLDKNRLGELGDFLEPTLLNTGNESNLLNQLDQGVDSNNQQQQGTDTVETGTVVPQQPKNQTSKQRKKVTVTVEQIRGQKTEMKEFDADEVESGKIASKK